MHVKAWEHVIASTDVSTNLMLHSNPEFVHFREILEYKLYSIHNSICISVEGNKILVYKTMMFTLQVRLNIKEASMKVS